MLLQAVNYHLNEKVAWAIQYVPHDLYLKKKVAEFGQVEDKKRKNLP